MKAWTGQLPYAVCGRTVLSPFYSLLRVILKYGSRLDQGLLSHAHDEENTAPFVLLVRCAETTLDRNKYACLTSLTSLRCDASVALKLEISAPSVLSLPCASCQSAHVHLLLEVTSLHLPMCSLCFSASLLAPARSSLVAEAAVAWVNTMLCLATSTSS